MLGIDRGIVVLGRLHAIAPYVAMLPLAVGELGLCLDQFLSVKARAAGGCLN